jgi:hypothetical protein
MAEKYRVWLHGSSMTASYDGYVDVLADDEGDAEDRALTKLTSKNGSFSDWSRSMFRVDKIERLRK